MAHAMNWRLLCGIAVVNTNQGLSSGNKPNGSTLVREYVATTRLIVRISLSSGKVLFFYQWYIFNVTHTQFSSENHFHAYVHFFKSWMVSIIVRNIAGRASSDVVDHYLTNLMVRNKASTCAQKICLLFMRIIILDTKYVYDTISAHIHLFLSMGCLCPWTFLLSHGFLFSNVFWAVLQLYIFLWYFCDWILFWNITLNLLPWNSIMTISFPHLKYSRVISQALGLMVLWCHVWCHGFIACLPLSTFWKPVLERQLDSLFGKTNIFCFCILTYKHTSNLWYKSYLSRQ